MMRLAMPLALSRNGGSTQRLGTGGIAHRLAVADGIVYWTTWGDAQARTASGCDAFETGTLRRILDKHGFADPVAPMTQ